LHFRYASKENISIREINDEVLKSSGGSWDKPPAYLVWNDYLRQRRDAHISDNRVQECWGFKDPRTLHTLPYWLEANINLEFVGTFRHPGAVIQSLKRRKNMPPVLPTLELWKYYNLELLGYLDTFKFPLICFDKAPNAYWRDIRELVRLLCLPKITDVTFDFFEEGLRTSRQTGEENEFVDAESMSIYKQLLSRAIDAVR